MADLVQKVTTDLSFIDGVLVPAGTLVNIDPSLVSDRNLADPGNALVNVAVAVAPIAPTGPNPTMPQQVPPGVFQTPAGYVTPGGAMLVAQGSEAAAEVARTGQQIDDSGDGEDGPRRQRSEVTYDATTAATGFRPSDAPVGDAQGNGISEQERAELIELRRLRDEGAFSQQQSGQSGEFDANAVISGTVPDVAKRLETLNREQLVAVQAAEDDREQPRAGVKHAIDARLAELSAADDI